jgi:Ca2+-binding EF-hand superfamily protein
MERKKQRSQVSGDYYQEGDFVIGRTVLLTGFKFLLRSADEYTEKYMEDNTDQFPEASYNTIIKKILAKGDKFPTLQEYTVYLLAKLDRNGDRFIDFRELGDGLRGLGINITNHEQHSLMRKFDKNGDGKISMEEFYNTLAEC